MAEFSLHKSFSIAGRYGATTNVLNHAACAFFNVSTNRYLYIKEIWITKLLDTVDNYGLKRISARGTPASTVTPDANSDYDAMNRIVPASAAVLDIGPYSGEPTLVGPAGNYLVRDNLPAVIGASFKWYFENGIGLAPNSGVAIVTPVAVILQSGDVTFIWGE